MISRKNGIELAILDLQQSNMLLTVLRVPAYNLKFDGLLYRIRVVLKVSLEWKIEQTLIRLLLQELSDLGLLFSSMPVSICSVVLRAWHCGILAILPPMSLKNAPSAGLRAQLKNLLIFSLFITISVLSLT